MLQSNYSPSYQSQSPQLDSRKAIVDNQPKINIQSEIDALEDLILNGTRVPLTELVILDEGLVLDRLDAIKEHLPTEFATAIKIVQSRQQILQQAENYARQLISSAEKQANNMVQEAAEQANTMVQEAAIVRQAELDAAKIKLKIEAECDRLEAKTQAEVEQWRELAKAECQEIQTGADRYADGVLSNLEQQFNEMLGVIKQGRQQLSMNNQQ